ncbi:MAG: L,D-transpeptidase family protein [Candidatus Omnitrophica bacterium]|nr:L,D-transpeptidase family protein [Candidatus Omnitrophota bacterium]
MDKRILIGGAAVLVVIVMVVFPKGKDKEKNPVPVETVSVQDMTGNELYDQASGLKKDGEIVQAKEAYQKILTDYPDVGNVEKVQKELEALNMELLFSKTPVPGKTVVHEIQSGDTLGGLASKYGTTIDLIKRSNNLSSDVIRIGQKLRIWTEMFNIFVDKSQNILILKDGDDVLKVYNVSTGNANSTPVGEFEITTRLIDPVWFNKGIVVPPESPQNVLGSRWLGFDLPGYGIHGTVEPETIGEQVTAGCIRMRNEEVEELYSIIPRGTKVIVAD